MVFNKTGKHVGPNGLREALADTYLLALLECLLSVVGRYSHYHNFRQSWILFSQLLLRLENSLRCFYTVHPWHVDVRQN